MLLSVIPLRILEAHGVPGAEVALLERHFGDVFPKDVSCPLDAMAWCIRQLPWPDVLAVVRPRLLEALQHERMDDEYMARRFLALSLDAPSGSAEGAAGASFACDLNGFIEVLMRVRGVSPTDPYALDGSAHADIRVWRVVLGLVGLAAVSARLRAAVSDADQVAAIVSKGVVGGLDMLSLSLPEEQRADFLDDALRSLVSRLAAFVSTWVSAWKPMTTSAARAAAYVHVPGASGSN